MFSTTILLLFCSFVNAFAEFYVKSFKKVSRKPQIAQQICVLRLQNQTKCGILVCEQGVDDMNIIGHFKTITTHRHEVIRNCFKAGIGFQGLFHDLSKYMPSEFFYGCKFYQGTRSPNEGEREDHGFSFAWMHHKGRNKHHFEYWVDINVKTNQYEPVPMPIRYVKEMFADRLAASKTYLKKDYNNRSALEYFVSHNARDKMHQKTADLLEGWLRMLSEKGEKETFKYIRKNFKNNCKY